MTGGLSRWMSTRTREQTTFVVTLVGMSGLLVYGMLMTGSVEIPEFSPRPREAASIPPVTAEGVDPRFDNYWFDPNPFAVETASRLPIPMLPSPDRPSAPMAAPTFAPAPAAELTSGAGLGEFFDFKPGAPPLAAAWAPNAETMQKLDAIVLPNPAEEKDLRDDRDVEWDTFHMKSGTTYEGIIVDETPTEYKVNIKNTSRLQIVQKENLDTFVSRATNLEKYEAAKKMLKPSDYKAHLQWAGWCREKGMVAEAIVMYEAARRLQPRETESIDALAELYDRSGRYEDAVELLTRACAEAKERNADYLTRAGEIYERLGLYEAAWRTYVRVITEVSTGHARARLGRAWMEYRLGDFDACRKTVNEILADKMVAPAEPLVLRALMTVVAPSGEIWGAPAEAELDKRLKAAKGDLDQVAALVKEGKVDVKMCAEWSNLLGVIAACQKSPEATTYFAGAVQFDANHVDAWTNLGHAATAAGQYDVARRLYGKAMLFDPANARAYSGMALTYVREENAAEAERWIKAALDSDPADAYPHYLRGHLAGDAPEAAAAFENALRRGLGHGGMCHAIADYFMRRADKLDAAAAPAALLAAEALYRRASLSARSTGAAMGLLSILLSQGRLEEADEEVKRLMLGMTAADPALQYVEGYLNYLREDEPAEKRLPRVLIDKIGPSAQAGYEPAKRAVELIEDWMATKVVVDESFERESGASVGSEWSEMMRDGVTAAVDAGRLKLGGEQPDTGINLVTIDFGGHTFWRAEGTFSVGTGDVAMAGMALYYQPAVGDDLSGLHVLLKGRPGERGFHVGIGSTKQAGGGSLTTSPAGGLAVPTKQFSVRIDAVEQDGRRHVNAWVRIDEEKEWQVVSTAMPIQGDSAKFRLGLLASGQKGRTFAVHVDEVKVYEKERRR